MRIRLPETALVIDAEATVDHQQRLSFGSYRLLNIRGEKYPMGACVAEGLFYDNELSERDPHGWAVLQAYAAERKPDLHEVRRTSTLALRPRREFLEKVFFPMGDEARALIVGFNLPFDLSRLAMDARAARWAYEGGFSLILAEYQDKDGNWHENTHRPRIDIRSISSKQHLMQFTGRRAADEWNYDTVEQGDGTQKKRPFAGHFLDLHTLAFGLADKNFSLERACKEFGVEHGKTKAEKHGEITPEYIDYNRRDVQATSELLVKLLEEHERHPIAVQPTKIFSPASVAKGYLRAMRVTSPMERQDDFAEEVLGYAMIAFYGGRAEARIRRVPLPVVYTDFVSMYPTVNSLMGNADFLRASRIDVVEATDEVREFVEQTTLTNCFRQETWSQLRALVQVRPNGEPFPVRAIYDPHGQTAQIGSNPLTCKEPLWFALPDVVAAKLLGGKTPEIVQALRLMPQGRLKGLRATKLRGSVAIDPRTQDFFKTVIQERKLTEGNRALEALERTRLDKALKVIANSGSYGIFAELNRKEAGGTKKTTVAAWNTKGEQFRAKVARPEEPGEFCFPPLAALITSAARLMLALLECSVRERGGSFVCCDTDSMTVVASEAGGLIACPGGQHKSEAGERAAKVLSWPEVNEIVARFESLNPYDREAVPGSVLKIEDENYIRKTTTQRELYGYAISAKRYVLYNLEPDGSPDIRKPLEHGLGHLMNPLDPDSDDKEKWIETIWRYIIDCDVRHLKVDEPEWFALPAVSRIGVSNPDALRLFDRQNRGRGYADRVKPFNFMLSCQVAEFGHPVGVDQAHFHLVAPYERRPDKWLVSRWFDRHSGKRYKVTTDDEGSREGIARIKTYGDVVESYRFHAEHKSVGPDGELSTQTTVGLLGRRSVEARRLRYVGKESNRLEEAQHGFIDEEDELLNEYEDPANDPFALFVVPVVARMPHGQLLAESDLHARTLERIIAGQQRPHKQTRAVLAKIAARYAGQELQQANVETPNDELDMLIRFLEVAGVRQKLCPECGAPVMSERATYCSARCRKRASRNERN